jgi:hypothetical protein
MNGLRGMDEKLGSYSEFRNNPLLCRCAAGHSYQSPTSQPASSVLYTVVCQILPVTGLFCDRGIWGNVGEVGLR